MIKNVQLSGIRLVDIYTKQILSEHIDSAGARKAFKKLSPDQQNRTITEPFTILDMVSTVISDSNL